MIIFTTGRRQQFHTTATQTKVHTSTIERHIGSIRNALHLGSANLLTQCIFQTQGRPHPMKRFCVSLLVRRSDLLSVMELLAFCCLRFADLSWQQSAPGNSLAL